VSFGLASALLVAAVLVFWVIGARNRLVALRNRIAEAWGRVAEALAQRGAAVEPLVSALREPMGSEAGALDALATAHGEAAKAAAAMDQRPVDAALAQAWVAAEGTLASAAARVLALLESQAELAQRTEVATSLAAWHDAQSRLPFARRFFNDAATAYNDAAAQFPTRIVARALGMGRAGLL
jgi:LemA protein